jgi:hypothetical protein
LSDAAWVRKGADALNGGGDHVTVGKESQACGAYEARVVADLAVVLALRASVGEEADKVWGTGSRDVLGRLSRRRVGQIGGLSARSQMTILILDEAIEDNRDLARPGRDDESATPRTRALTEQRSNPVRRHP